ncbi:MAG: hypothetical protein IPK82_31705 [Polyangiaceae bacterium]|nr:hypothetical protein [Polyangiaceae bacterium]
MRYALITFAALFTAGCVGPQEYAEAPSCPRKAAPASVRSASIDPEYFGGQWQGQGCQSDGPCWTIAMQLEGDESGNPTGRIAYPSDHCVARLEFVRWEAGDVAAFRERFDRPGKCVPNGWVKLSLVNKNTLNFVWAHPDGRVDAGTTLYRAE